MTIYNNITEAIGKTPMVRLNKIVNVSDRILVKPEFFNPGGSVKDRAALSMIEAAENEGKLKSGNVIVEPTSGNTGIGLALVCAVKGYKLILTMPESMTVERQKILKAYGAALILTPEDKGMRGAIANAEQIKNENPGSFMPMQFENPANPEIHRRTTAMEIWEQTNGEVDVFVACAGTGGTITGVSEVLKQKKPGIKTVAVEPASSPVLSGGQPGKHKIPGTGPGFIPKILNKTIIDEIISVEDEEALNTAKLIAEKEGILCGISSGAAVYAAIKVAREPENQGKLITVILPDTGERYLSEF